MSKEIWSFLGVETDRVSDIAVKMATEARRLSERFEAKPCGIIFSSSNVSIKDLEPYGLEKIYSYHAEEPLSPEVFSASISSLVVKFSPEFILFPSTLPGSELASRVAASLEKGLITNCIDIEIESERELQIPIARRPFFGGKCHGVVKWSTSPPYFATINLDSLESLEAENIVSPEIIIQEFEAAEGKIRFMDHWKVTTSELDLTEAEVVIGVGRGVDKKEFMEVIQKLAETVGGVVGGSRIAFYNGLISREKMIGVSGKWISPVVYVPVGVSGVAQHAMGIKGAKHIIVINISKEAPIFKYSELGIVGDLYEVIPEILNLMGKETE